MRKGEEWDTKMEYWKTLFSDEDAEFDCEHVFKAEDIAPMVTYGTNPGMGIAVTGKIPTSDNLTGSDKESYIKALENMGFNEGEELVVKKIDYVFVGSCTNGRIKISEFAAAVKGKKKCDDVVVWLVPGSKEVERLANEEGLTTMLRGWFRASSTWL